MARPNGSQVLSLSYDVMGLMMSSMMMGRTNEPWKQNSFGPWVVVVVVLVMVHHHYLLDYQRYDLWDNTRHHKNFVVVVVGVPLVGL